MKLSKLLVSCVAAGALAAACTTAAFAADAVTATYADGKVTISGFQTYASAVSGDLTLLILSEDTTVTSDNANNIIMQIDQFGKNTVTVAEDGTYSKEVTVGTLDTANKTYYVRLGGAEVSDLYANGFVATTFSTSTTPQYTLGDVNNDGSIDVFDSLKVKQAEAKLVTLTDIETLAADVNKDKTVDVFDSLKIKQYEAIIITSFE